jgi:hypothetical protein
MPRGAWPTQAKKPVAPRSGKRGTFQTAAMGPSLRPKRAILVGTGRNQINSREKNELWLLMDCRDLATPIQCHCIPGIHRHGSPGLRNSSEVLSHVQSGRRIARGSWWESVLLSSNASRCANVSALSQRDQNTFVSDSKRGSYT